MPKRKAPDVNQWCDNDLLNRVIGKGPPSSQVGVRLSQVSRMMRFLGSFDQVEYSFTWTSPRLVLQLAWAMNSVELPQDWFYNWPELWRLLMFCNVLDLPCLQHLLGELWPASADIPMCRYVFHTMKAPEVKAMHLWDHMPRSDLWERLPHTNCVETTLLKQLYELNVCVSCGLISVKCLIWVHWVLFDLFCFRSWEMLNLMNSFLHCKILLILFHPNHGLVWCLLPETSSRESSPQDREGGLQGWTMGSNSGLQELRGWSYGYCFFFVRADIPERGRQVVCGETWWRVIMFWFLNVSEVVCHFSF